jgi:hypothetical protein
MIHLSHRSRNRNPNHSLEQWLENERENENENETERALMCSAFAPPEVCPVCGEEVPRAARSCPSCGADERTGWNEDETRYDGLDLPDEAYDRVSDAAPRKPWNQRVLWVCVALALIIFFIVSVF